MLTFWFAMVVKFSLVLGIAIILSTTVPRLPTNKLYRFIILFILSVPLNVAINYVNVWALGYHKISWLGTLVFAFFLAAWATFVPPRSNTPSMQ